MLRKKKPSTDLSVSYEFHVRRDYKSSSKALVICSAGRNFEVFACLGLKKLAVNVNSEVTVFVQLL